MKLPCGPVVQFFEQECGFGSYSIRLVLLVKLLYVPSVKEWFLAGSVSSHCELITMLLGNTVVGFELL